MNEEEFMHIWKHACNTIVLLYAHTHIKELKEKIDNTIEKEKQAIGIHHHESLRNQRLKEKIDQLHSKLQGFTNVYTERKTRIQELEKKITGSSEKDKIIKEIEEQIAILENRYTKMLAEHKKADLDKIKNKIDLLKSKLEKLKYP